MPRRRHRPASKNKEAVSKPLLFDGPIRGGIVVSINVLGASTPSER
ncbi:hypothetical protein RISK_000928 [Rhodopirellula islandica]|uniref:Uncharacterized protein n=1 Tax=Rhodopirellula islandica TaxID=595434 RepID=A0A0J1BKU7_RHOIS|nr:hypothetical protein RISK_000928 [Rhodopirellula islandica]